MGVPVATTGANVIVTGLDVVGASVATGVAVVGEFVAYNTRSSRQKNTLQLETSIPATNISISMEQI